MTSSFPLSDRKLIPNADLRDTKVPRKQYPIERFLVFIIYNIRYVSVTASALVQ